LLRSYLVQSHSVNAIGVQPADFVIEPVWSKNWNEHVDR
jgi:hypothetical protein